ncbi:MAG: 3-methyl-2-oxobutanoate hydroxymethyltransferase [Lachnospiraceae bacterium]|jgi:3-methyl-2-oxobutanoate hydroxymethyltransferase|nr:3-methyl-2-oxobutanoate hydroxymethyltransferase [Lachnospiraceae bacterium]
MTVKELLEKKGKEKIIAVNTSDLSLAIACAQAGVDNIVIGRRQPVEITLAVLPEIRRAVPGILLTAVMPHSSAVISEETAIRDAMRLLEGGADLVYTTGMCPDRIKALTRQKIPCVSHLGLIPYHATWTGGFRAVGKTAVEAEELYRKAKELEEAGVVCVELECIPDRVAAHISNSVRFLTYSMGSGEACDGQYLFACDLLGSHNGHYPRHSICYESFFEKSVEVFRRFRKDVETGAYPQKKHKISMEEGEYKDFLERVGKE